MNILETNVTMLANVTNIHINLIFTFATMVILVTRYFTINKQMHTIFVYLQ
jgi:hypothetical protein